MQEREREMSEEIKGLIFDIQPYSTHDGPGTRTNVFFVGCPLQCKWCANPESWEVKKKTLMFAERTCKWDQGCRACRDACPYGSLKVSDTEPPSVDWGICSKCTTIECKEFCAANALKQPIREMTVDEVHKILLRDMNSWGSSGGVTFTGGEPLMHHDFLVPLLKKCKASMIHTAIETTGFTSEDRFMDVFRMIDFAFIDVKIMDEDRHRYWTGVTNKVTQNNIRALKRSSWPGRLVLRIPTIHGVNDSIRNAERVIEFMNENDLYEINLLRFHRMGSTKWEQLGKKYAFDRGGDISEETLLELQNLYRENDIACYIGDDTPF